MDVVRKKPPRHMHRMSCSLQAPEIMCSELELVQVHAVFCLSPRVKDDVKLVPRAVLHHFTSIFIKRAHQAFFGAWRDDLCTLLDNVTTCSVRLDCFASLDWLCAWCVCASFVVVWKICLDHRAVHPLLSDHLLLTLNVCT